MVLGIFVFHDDIFIGFMFKHEIMALITHYRCLSLLLSLKVAFFDAFAVFGENAQLTKKTKSILPPTEPHPIKMLLLVNAKNGKI